MQKGVIKKVNFTPQYTTHQIFFALKLAPPTKPIVSNKKPNSPTFKKITPSEIQYTREHNLCFKCGDKFSPDHQCNMKKVYLLLVVDKMDNEHDETEGEIIEYEGINSGKEMKFVVYSLSGQVIHNIIKLKGQLKGKMRSILLDGESTHSFAKPTVAHLCSEKMKDIKPFKVNVANGEYLTCELMISSLTWTMQRLSFTHDLFVLEIEPNNLIIGVD